MEKHHRLWTLFTSMLYISAFTFGGGFVIVSLMQKKFVEELHWLEEDEMLDMTALAQASPGAIAVNGAILVGRKLAGIPGIAVAVLGTILPPADGHIRILILVRAHISAALFENQLHLKMRILVQGSDMHVGIDDLYLVIHMDVRGSHLTGTLSIDRDLLVLGKCHAVQRGHRLALAAGTDDNRLAARQTADL